MSEGEHERRKQERGLIGDGERRERARSLRDDGKARPVKCEVNGDRRRGTERDRNACKVCEYVGFDEEEIVVRK